MGIFSKIFHTDELELHNEAKSSNDEKTKQGEDENDDEVSPAHNTEPSPFLADEQDTDV